MSQRHTGNRPQNTPDNPEQSNIDSNPKTSVGSHNSQQNSLRMRLKLVQHHSLTVHEQQDQPNNRDQPLLITHNQFCSDTLLSRQSGQTSGCVTVEPRLSTVHKTKPYTTKRHVQIQEPTNPSKPLEQYLLRCTCDARSCTPWLASYSCSSGLCYWWA